MRRLVVPFLSALVPVAPRLVALLAISLLAITCPTLSGCPTSHCGTRTTSACSCTDGRAGTRSVCADGTPDGECTCTGPLERDGGALDGGARDAGRADAPVLDAGPPPCIRDIDLLFEIDTSNSMTQEQLLLRAELPRLVRALATGDRDGDGIQDFPAVRSLHLGVITPDLGAGPVRPGTEVPTCNPGFGDDGLLRSTVRGTDPGCPAAYPSGIFEFTRATGNVEAVAHDFACVASVGTGGCGFEQQLEAALKALSPSVATPWVRPDYVAPTFIGGVPGHGDGANAGFLREGSLLALTLLTDEDDCSVPDYELFYPDSTVYAGNNLNLRCSRYADSALLPIDRYRDGFLQLREDPRLLVFTAITGTPVGVSIDDTAPGYAALLARPEMAIRENPDATNLEPVCDRPETGVAFPARRLVETARQLSAAGAHTHVGSICSGSFAADIDAIIDAIEAGAPACE